MNAHFLSHESGRPLVMGIVNVTPDSFSDGGHFSTPLHARDYGLKLLDQGADWLDIGGESTRPGAQPVSEGEELNRVMPVIEALLARRPDVKISIDTMKPAVAEAAITAGALMWNDVNALRAPDALDMAAKLECLVCLMHMQGEPTTMQDDPHYDDVVADVARYLGQRAGAALARGVERSKIILDPGVGFGKTLEHNLTVLSALDQFSGLGFPILFGGSRKRFISGIDATASFAKDRLGGSLAVALHAAQARCNMIRVHDVRETVQALAVHYAIQNVR